MVVLSHAICRDLVFEKKVILNLASAQKNQAKVFDFKALYRVVEDGFPCPISEVLCSTIVRLLKGLYLVDSYMLAP